MTATTDLIPPRRRRAAIVAALLVLTVPGCGDADDPPPGGAGGPAGSPAAAPGGAKGQQTLTDLLGLGGDTAAQAQRIGATERDRQQLIRECMAKQGFEYVAHVVAGQRGNASGLPTDLPEAEFRVQYGYGISTGFENALKLKPSQKDADPNVAIVAKMSESQKAAYERALSGDGTTNGEQGGCAGEAAKKTDKAGIVVQRLGNQLTELYSRIDADRRVVDAERGWRDCMAKAGYAVADENAIIKEISRRMNPLYDALSGEDVPDGVADLYRDRRLTPDQQAILASAKAYELQVAAADQSCRGDIDKVRATVRDEYEADFVDKNRAQLRQIFPNSGL